MTHRLLPLLVFGLLLAPVRGIAEQRSLPASGFAESRTVPAIGQPPAVAPAWIAQAAPGAPRPQPVANVGGSVGRPDIKVGDWWRYRVTDTLTKMTQSVSIEVTAVTENRIHTRTLESALDAAGPPAAAGVIGVWDRDWNQLGHGGIEYKPFYPALQFPLEPGKQWSGAVQWDSGSGTLRHQLTAQVAGWERVAVPAGSFDAVRITVRGYISESGSRNYYAQSGSISNVIWYAPAVGQIVKKEIDHRDNTPIFLGRLAERWELVEHRRHEQNPR